MVSKTAYFTFQEGEDKYFWSGEQTSVKIDGLARR